MSGFRLAVSRISRGEVSADIVGKPRLWYSLSAVLLVISIAGLVIQGLNFGVEFRGGSVFSLKAPNASISQVRDAVRAGGAHQAIVQEAGDRWRVTTESLDSAEVTEVKKSITERLGVPAAEVDTQVVGGSWGGEISKKAWQALVVFMILIVGYLSVAFEWRMALAAVVALVHDLVITAGVYAWSGFEVTPATLLGFLTILGYSLYDAVVVFDMIKEVTRPLGPKSKITYSQAANDALNSTLVRSLNTSLVAILPVASILFIGTTLFGAGTLKDLSLSLFVGILVGTYSSLCVATPLLVQLKEREPKYREIRERIAARESSAKRRARPAKARDAEADAADAETGDGDADRTDDQTGAQPPEKTAAPAARDGRPRKLVQQGARVQPQRGTRRSRGRK